MPQDFRQKLESRVILGDGAMGTQLYARGIYFNRNYDQLNLTDPHLIKAIHRDYIQAGAQVIETNTFGANKFRLGKFGLEDKVYEINQIGAQLARRCAEETSGVMVAGAIGPLGKPVAPIGKISDKDTIDAFSIQVEGLLAGRVDLIMLETFLDLHELLLAIEVVRKYCQIPLVAMMTIDQNGNTIYGRSPVQVASVLNAEDVDVIGLNCSTGPQNILEGIAQMSEVSQKPLAAFANAGIPLMKEGRLIYLSTPEYFAEYTKRMIGYGVSFIGGCCGTTPEHIRLMSAAIRALQPVHDRDADLLVKTRSKTKKCTEVEQLLPEKKSKLGKLLAENKFPVSCEIHPPRSPNVGKILRQVRALLKAGINQVNIPDGPRASARMSPMALAHLIHDKTGMETILHYTCRDRNILGMQSDLLGCEALGLKNILIVTGDPPKLGDYPMATAVFDVDSIGLLRIARRLNCKMDIVGNPITRQTSFYLGAGFNPGAIDLVLEIERLHKKIEAGAEYILTQPVFDFEKFHKALEKIGKISIPLMIGILPLASYRNAEFFHNEVPGMQIPDHILNRMKEASNKSKDHAVAEGILIAQQSLLQSYDYVNGTYIMPPFGKVETAIETISVLPGRKSKSEINSEK